MIIGLHGEAGAGKDYLGQALVGYFGYERRAFADEMKAMLLEMDPILEHNPFGEPIRLSEAFHVYGENRVKKGFPEYRRLAEKFATEVMRDRFSQDVWLNLATKDMPDDGKVVFTDVRFPNEAGWIILNGGLVVEVVREETYGLDRDGHASRKRLPDSLINGGTFVNDAGGDEKAREFFEELIKGMER